MKQKSGLSTGLVALVILLLFAYKCLYPKHLHLNRGNHESVNMNKMYGFEGEVASKYSAEMMALFTDIFQWLPLAHVIEQRWLTVDSMFGPTVLHDATKASLGRYDVVKYKG